MSHFVIPAALRNNLSSHFVIPAALCYNFQSHFVTIFFTLCNSHRMDLDPKLGGWNLKTREPSSRKRDSKSRHRVQVLESRTLDPGPRTKTQDLTTLTKVKVQYYTLFWHFLHELFLSYRNIHYKLTLTTSHICK